MTRESDIGIVILPLDPARRVECQEARHKDRDLALIHLNPSSCGAIASVVEKDVELLHRGWQLRKDLFTACAFSGAGVRNWKLGAGMR